MSCQSQLLYTNRGVRTRANEPCSNRLVTSCHRKCIAPEGAAHRYVEGDLLKGEAVCIDRCTAKFFEVSHNLRIQREREGHSADMHR